MNHYDGYPNYDPNLLPQWQKPSQIEKKFVRLVQLLSEQETKSLLCGSAYKEADEELLNKRRQMFLQGANPFMLRYNFPDEPNFCYEENIDSFFEMKKDLIDPLESTHPEQVVSLSWDIDCLARNPYKALLSWQCAFNKYLESVNNTSAMLRRETYCAFHESTFYLLCIFIPYTYNDVAFNPMQISTHLQSSFFAEIKVFFTILDVYPPVKPPSKIMDTEAKDLSYVMVYDYWMNTKSAWYAPADFFKRVKKPLYQIFANHIKRNGFALDDESLERNICYIMESCAENGKFYYLLPFICTKFFAQWFCGKASESLSMTDDSLEDSLDDYETFERLFNKHHRKILRDDIYNSDENDHPVIAFMLDMVSLCYEFEMIDLKKLNGEETAYVESEHRRTEFEVMEQINTNWLILYLYGNGRLFNDPCICSHFCELNLPIFLRHLFFDEEQQGDLQLNKSWLFYLAHINDTYNLDRKVMEKLYADCALEMEKMSQPSPAWKEQLAAYIFDPSLWEDTSLNAQSTEFQTQIDRINSLINKVDTLLTENCIDSDPPSMIIRGIYIAQLFRPILDDLEYYLETSASLDTYWELSIQLKQYCSELRRYID